ncbi:ribonuclease H-like domain-containing protein [Tanacetum coccineum]
MRTWTTDEDTKLVDALMKIRLSGKYTDVYNNKFRTGYLEALERMLNVSLPNMGIKADPHIKSRLKTLRNNLKIVNDMLVGKHMSGFSWDHEKLCVDADDHVWDKYIKIKKTAARFRKWPFPHYDKLCIIYGKERVRGLRADGIGGEDDEEEIKINPSYEAEDDTKGEENVEEIIVHTSFESEDNVEGEDNVEEININTSLEAEELPVSVDVSSFDGAKESVGDKRKRDETSELNETCVETKLASQGITAANEIMDIVTTQMNDLQGLTLDERLLAMSVIGRSAPLSLMFERLDDEGKIRMAQMVAHGYIT